MGENQGKDFLSPEITKLAEKIKKDPSSRLFFPLAEEYLKRGLLDESISVLTQGLELWPDFHGARVSLGKAYLQKGQTAEAKAQFEKVLSAKPDNLMAQKKLALIYRDEQDYPQAQKLCQAVLSVHEKDPDMIALKAELDRVRADAPAEPSQPVPQEGASPGSERASSQEAEFGKKPEDTDLSQLIEHGEAWQENTPSEPSQPSDRSGHEKVIDLSGEISSETPSGPDQGKVMDLSEVLETNTVEPLADEGSLSAENSSTHESASVPEKGAEDVDLSAAMDRVLHGGELSEGPKALEESQDSVTEESVPVEPEKGIEPPAGGTVEEASQPSSSEEMDLSEALNFVLQSDEAPPDSSPDRSVEAVQDQSPSETEDSGETAPVVSEDSPPRSFDEQVTVADPGEGNIDLSMEMKDVLQGREPREPSGPTLEGREKEAEEEEKEEVSDASQDASLSESDGKGERSEEIFSDLLGSLSEEIQESSEVTPRQEESSGSVDTAPAEPQAAVTEGAMATMVLGELYIRQGHYEQGIEIFRKILEKDPGNEQARRRLQDLTSRRAEPAEEHTPSTQPSPSAPKRSEELRRGRIDRLQAWIDQLKRSYHP